MPHAEQLCLCDVGNAMPGTGVDDPNLLDLDNIGHGEKLSTMSGCYGVRLVGRDVLAAGLRELLNKPLVLRS